MTVATLLMLGAAQGIANSPERRQEDIVVTGSRLRANGAPLQPVVTVETEDLARSGAVTAADLLNELPQFGNAFGATSQDFNSANRGFNVGTELINLRGLGAQRTLVLVDGRRHVGSDPGTGAVDLNAIPAALIDRIEIVTGANSAVYGADAVSGVINVILKQRFAGAQASAHAGVSSRGDGREVAAGLVHGRAFGDRLHGLAAAEYSRRDGFLGRNREWVRGDGSSASYSVGAGSSAIDGGRFVTAGPRGVFTYPDPAGPPLTFGASIPLFQRIYDRHLQIPVERALASLKLDYKAAENLTLFAESAYARTEASVQFEPQFLQFRADATPNQFDLGPIPANAPGLALFLRDTGATRLDANAIQSRRFSEYGPRYARIERDLVRGVIGVRADTGRFRYSAYYQYGKTVTRQEDGPSVDRTRFYAGVNDCAGAFALAGCVPIDLFGDALSAAAIDFTLIPEVASKLRNDQHVASGFVAADLAGLAGSPVQAVAGVEYRRESASARVDPSLRDRTNAIRQISAANGSFEVREVFGELKWRLPDGGVSLGAAARVSDYSTVGSKLTWNVAGGLRPFDALDLRASYGQATRAPNISELFAPVVSATATLDDPCANDRNPQDGVADPDFVPPPACLAGLGPGYVVGQAPGGTALGNRSGGNPALGAETAKSLTVGASLAAPRWFGLTLSADYFDIRLSDVVGALGTAQVVNGCYAAEFGSADALCGLITRAGTGGRGITSVSTQLFNISSERVRGVDVQARMALPTAAGRFTAGLDYTHLFERSRRDFDGAPTADVTGRFDAIREGGRASLGFAGKAFSVDYTARFLGAALKGTSAANRRAVDDAASARDNSNRIGTYVYHDLHAAFAFADRQSFVIGIKNLADVDPPLITEFSNAGVVGSAGVTAGGVYDVRGRFFYVRMARAF